MEVEAMQPAEELVAADVLIVDDDDDLRDMLAAVLESRGYRVRGASNGREGLRLVAERPPALLLLDVDMPELAGPELAEALYAHDRGLELIPIVLVSGNVRLAATAGAVGTPYFLEKPYSIDSVLGLVGRALRERVPPKPSTGGWP